MGFKKTFPCGCFFFEGKDGEDLHLDPCSDDCKTLQAIHEWAKNRRMNVVETAHMGEFKQAAREAGVLEEKVGKTDFPEEAPTHEEFLEAMNVVAAFAVHEGAMVGTAFGGNRAEVLVTVAPPHLTGKAVDAAFDQLETLRSHQGRQN